MLFELATGKPPFNNNMLKDLIQEILEKDVPRIEGYSDQFNDLLQGLLAKVRKVNEILSFDLGSSPATKLAPSIKSSFLVM